MACYGLLWPATGGKLRSIFTMASSLLVECTSHRAFSRPWMCGTQDESHPPPARRSRLRWPLSKVGYLRWTNVLKLEAFSNFTWRIGLRWWTTRWEETWKKSRPGNRRGNRREHERTWREVKWSESSPRVRTLRVFVPEDTGMYFVHVWKSCGMKMDNVRFIWASDFIEENATEPLSCHVLKHVRDVRDRVNRWTGEPVNRGPRTSLLQKPAVSRSVTRICRNFLPQKLSQKIQRMLTQTGVGWVFAPAASPRFDLSIAKGKMGKQTLQLFLVYWSYLILERTVSSVCKLFSTLWSSTCAELQPAASSQQYILLTFCKPFQPLFVCETSCNPW